MAVGVCECTQGVQVKTLSGVMTSRGNPEQARMTRRCEESEAAMGLIDSVLRLLLVGKGSVIAPSSSYRVVLLAICPQ